MITPEEKPTNIKIIYVEKRDKVSDYFASGFERILALQDIKNSDIQIGIEEIFKPKKDNIAHKNL